MTRSGQKLSLSELDAILDSFGGDVSRWPAAKRAAAEILLAENASARKMVADAKVFDALLDRAPAVDSVRVPELARQIVATAARSAPAGGTAPAHAGQGGLAADNVIPLRRRAEPARPAVRPAARHNFRTMAVLAASLAMGIMIGALDLVPRSVTQFTGLSGSGTEIEQSVSSMHSDDLSDVLDEDFL
jgi:hypothetical protein